MATIAEKDVLLEYTNFAHLIKNRDEQADMDIKKAGELWERILMTDLQDLDFEKTKEEIRKLRARYERKETNIIENNLSTKELSLKEAIDYINSLNVSDFIKNKLIESVNNSKNYNYPVNKKSIYNAIEYFSLLKNGEYSKANRLMTKDMIEGAKEFLKSKGLIDE